MKQLIPLLFAALLAAFTLTACGRDPELAQFKNNIEDFCTKVSEIDAEINSIDASSENAVSELLSCLDCLDDTFQKFAALDFPDEFSYLKETADQAGEYMSEAVASYHEAYQNHSYDEATAAYAKENYARAYKRIQIILSFLHGEEPSDAELQYQK